MSSVALSPAAPQYAMPYHSHPQPVSYSPPLGAPPSPYPTYPQGQQHYPFARRFSDVSPSAYNSLPRTYGYDTYRGSEGYSLYNSHTAAAAAAAASAPAPPPQTHFTPHPQAPLSLPLPHLPPPPFNSSQQRLQPSLSSPAIHNASRFQGYQPPSSSNRAGAADDYDGQEKEFKRPRIDSSGSVPSVHETYEDQHQQYARVSASPPSEASGATASARAPSPLASNHGSRSGRILDSPPSSDFISDDPEVRPYTQNVKHGEDLYTPVWARGHNKEKEGFCDMCDDPGKWLQLKNSAYW
jgi:hypothetical protein